MACYAVSLFCHLSHVEMLVDLSKLVNKLHIPSNLHGQTVKIKTKHLILKEIL